MIRTLIVVVIFILVCRASILAPFGALMGYLWFALFRPQEWLWIDISMLRPSLVLGGVLLFRSLAAGALPDLRHPISKGILLFLTTGLVAQANVVSAAVGWEWLDFFVRLALVCLLLTRLVDTPRRLYYTVGVICSCLGFFSAKAGLVSLLFGGVRFTDGLAGAYIDNNGYALAAVMVMPMLHATAEHIPSDWPMRKAFVWGYRLAVPLTAFAVISTFSRGGLLALLAVLILFVMLQKRGILILGLLLLLSVLVYPFIPLPEGYQARVTTISTYEEVGETSALSRLHFWRVAWDMALENPLGVGMGNYKCAYDRYDFSDGQYGRSRAVHSSHFQVLTEHGFLGLFVWLGLFLGSIRICLKVRRLARERIRDPETGSFFAAMATALMLSMVGFLVGGSFIALALNDLTWITFALVASLDRLCMAEVGSEEAKAAEEPEPGKCFSPAAP